MITIIEPMTKQLVDGGKLTQWQNKADAGLPMPMQ